MAESLVEEASEEIDCPWLAGFLLAVLLSAQSLSLLIHSPKGLQPYSDALQVFGPARGSEAHGQNTKTMGFAHQRSQTSHNGSGYLAECIALRFRAQLAVNATGNIPAQVLEQLAVGQALLTRGMHQLPGSASIPVPCAPASHVSTSHHHARSSFPVLFLL